MIRLVLSYCFFSLILIETQAQDGITGYYQSGYSNLELYKDSTYHNKTYGCFRSILESGNYSQKGDTIFLTEKYSSPRTFYRDSFAYIPTPEGITLMERHYVEIAIPTLHEVPDMLFHHDNALYNARSDKFPHYRGKNIVFRKYEYIEPNQYSLNTSDYLIRLYFN